MKITTKPAQGSKMISSNADTRLFNAQIANKGQSKVKKNSCVKLIGMLKKSFINHQ